MKQKLLVTLTALSLLIAACSAPANSATVTPEAAATVIADSTIIAEGRLEPVRFAEIAFTASGVVSDVLVAEGQTVNKGEVIVQLGDASDTNYAAAQLELADAQQALNDLQNAAGTDLAQTVIDLKEATEEYNDAVDYLDYLQNADKVPQTETRRFLIQTWKGYEYRTKDKTFKGPAPQDWIIEAENDLALKKAQMDDAQKRYDRLKDGIDGGAAGDPRSPPQGRPGRGGRFLGHRSLRWRGGGSEGQSRQLDQCRRDCGHRGRFL
jgi:multidrug efflux pump subunit AcrA (membrane-fusion protein)